MSFLTYKVLSIRLQFPKKPYHCWTVKNIPSQARPDLFVVCYLYLNSQSRKENKGQFFHHHRHLFSWRLKTRVSFACRASQAMFTMTIFDFWKTFSIHSSCKQSKNCEMGTGIGLAVGAVLILNGNVMPTFLVRNCDLPSGEKQNIWW